MLGIAKLLERERAGPIGWFVAAVLKWRVSWSCEAVAARRIECARTKYGWQNTLREDLG